MCVIAGGVAATITMMDVVAVAAAAASAVAAMNAAKARQNQANYQAQVAENNQKIAQHQAIDALTRGSEKERNQRLKVEGFKGKQRSILAASGFDANTDDALDILADTAAIGEVDALTVRNNAEREAYQYRVAASSSGAQAGLFGMQADAISPIGEGGFAFGSGMADVADKWTQRNTGKTAFGMRIQ